MLQTMNIEQLRYLAAVATFSSINQASTALHMSQPNLSLALKSLEEELGYDLFNRTHRGIEMTAKGLLFLEQAKNVLLQFDSLKARDDTRSSDGPALTVATTPLCRVHYALAQFFRTRQALPRNISVEEALRDQVVQLVSNQDCEIGILYVYDTARKSLVSQCNAKNVQCFSLAPCSVSVLMGRGNPLFSEKPEFVSVAQLKEFYRVSYGKLGRASYSRTLVPGLSGTAGEIIVNDQVDFHKVLDSCPSFSIAPRGKKILQINDISFVTHYCDIEGVSVSGDFMFIKHQARQLSDAAAEFIEIVRSWLV